MTASYAQRDKQANTPSSIATEKGKSPSTQKVLAPNNCTTQLSTPALAGNGNSGTMFDLVATHDVIIKNVGCSFSSPEITVEVYTRPGTHVGNETSSTGWIFRGDTRMTVAISTPVEIPVAIYEKVSAGDTMGVYIRVTAGDGVDYTDGTTLGAPIVSDAALQILEGTGITDFGGSTFTPRNLNGFVTYCNELACYSEFSNAVTSFTSGNGNDGNIFEITALQDFTLKKFYTNCNGTGGWEVYYRNGSYTGHTSDIADWILLDSLSITCNAADSPTEIPLPVYMDIDAGQTVSFYITGTVTGADINYFNGTTEGATYANYGAFVLREGLGVAYPLAGTNSPRVWSGSIDYCDQGFLATSENKMVNGLSVLVYPNPAKDVINFSIADEITGKYTISITDIQGRTIEQLTPAAAAATLATDGYQSGVYLYQVVSNQGAVAIGNFIIE